MSSFNEKLKEIRIWELILVFLIPYILISFLELGEEIYLVIIAYVLLRTRNQIRTAIDDIRNIFDHISLKECLLLMLSLYFFALGSGMLLDQFFESYYTFYYIPGLLIIGGGAVPFLLDFAFSVIIGPIAEELSFRAILLNGFNKKSFAVIIAILISGYFIAYPVTKVSFAISMIYMALMILAYWRRKSLIVPIVLSSVFFAFMHPISTVLSTTLFGICMCILYLKTENIFVPIFIHLMNNLISLIVGYTPNLETLLKSNITIAIIGILSFVSLIYILKFIYVEYCHLSH